MSGRALPLVVALVAACASVGMPPASLVPSLPLRRVVVYRNGLGYFERAGRSASGHLKLRLRQVEVDPFMKSLAVLAPQGGTVVGSVAALVYVKDSTDVELDLTVAPDRDLTVGYVAPTSAWRSFYKLLIGGGQDGVLQTWAAVDNNSDQDWPGVHLTLATGEPSPPPDPEAALFAPADADRDHDRIPDAIDACPDEPETYNGYQDEDGCPDHARVLPYKGLAILDRIYFAPGSDQVKKEAEPLIDALAAAIKDRPDIKLVDVQGHSSEDERGTAFVAEARAVTVRKALVARGVPRERLVVRAFGATRPLCTMKNENCRSLNRRVDFAIHRRELPRPEPVAGAPAGGVAGPAVPRPPDGEGLRYEIATPVTIPARSSAMVAVANQRLAVAEVYFYRPQASAPGSDSHLYRAARFQCPGGASFSGPVAIYARGSYAGDSTVDCSRPGELSLVPFGLDAATTVHAVREPVSEPGRIVKIARGLFTLEDRQLLRTRYELAGGRPGARGYLRHEPRDGYATDQLPPGSEQEGGVDLIPVDLDGDGGAVASIEESRLARREIDLREEPGIDLQPYLAGTRALPAGLAERLRHLTELRAAADRLDVEQELLRRQVDDGAQRLIEVRGDLEAAERSKTAGPLRRQLAEEQAKVERANEALSRQATQLATERDDKRAQFRAQLGDLVYDPAGP
ncbi:MAG TPA: OmpA family protein [Polyangia bacterium]|nr:OmpA family protein [Polyangia bacterium]